MNPGDVQILSDGAYAVCWNGYEWDACFWKEGEIERDIEETDITANCGVIDSLAKTNKITFTTTFTSYDCAQLGFLFPQLADTDSGTGLSNISIGNAQCSQAVARGPLLIKLTCAPEGCNTIFFPYVSADFLTDTLSLGDAADEGVRVTVRWTAYPAPASSPYAGKFMYFGAPDVTVAQTYDCENSQWV